MAVEQIRQAVALYIDGVQYMTDEAPMVSESIDNFGTVVEFSLIERPDPIPAEDAVVELQLVDLDANTYISLFGGYVAGRVAESEPHSLRFRAVDELSKFSALRTTNDLNLTGMTDGEAWEAIAGVCDVDFDTADIVDTGYILGEHAPVYWKVDSSGASIIDELDRVFSCKTMTVLNNRVVRIFYDRVAHSADIQASYEAGVSADLWRNSKDTADSSAVQSLWRVQGVTAPCGDDDACSCMLWAKSVGTTPKRGKKISRIPTSTFQSDLIQDEVLAQAISRRMMRWYNRIPIVIAAEMATDPNIHPGCVIGIIDPAYGIDAVTELPVFVTSVDKRGSEMSVIGIGGAGGSQGTTTSGVERRCNTTEFDDDWGGDWDFGTLTFPPIGISGIFLGDFDFTFPVFGGEEDGGGGGDYPVGIAVAAEWVNDANPPGSDFVIAGSTITGPIGANGVALTSSPLLPERSAGVPKNYKVEFSLSVSDATSNVELFAEDESFAVHWWMSYFNGSPQNYFMAGCYYNATCPAADFSFGAITPGATVAVTIEWDADAVEYTVSVGASTQVIAAADSGVTGPILFSAISANSTGTCTVSNFEITVLE